MDESDKALCEPLDLNIDDVGSVTVYLGLVLKGRLLDVVRLRETLKEWPTIWVVYQHMDSEYLFIQRGCPAEEEDPD